MLIRKLINKIRNRHSIPRLKSSQDPCPECGGLLLKEPYEKMMYPPIESWTCVDCGRMFDFKDRIKYPAIVIDLRKQPIVGEGQSFGNVAAIAKLKIKEQ